LLALIAAVDTFDSGFVLDAPPSRLAMLLIKNIGRDRPDLPRESSRLKEVPELAGYFSADVPFRPFPFSRYFEVFEREIRPVVDKSYLVMDTMCDRLSFQKGRPEQKVVINEVYEFTSDDSPIVNSFGIGDTVIFQHRYRATVAGFSSEGVTIMVDRTPVPSCSEFLGVDARFFFPINSCFQSLGIGSKFFRVANRILGTIMIGGVNCGLGVVRQLNVGDERIRVGRLGLIRITRRPNGYDDLFISARVRDAIVEWCRRAPALPRLIEGDRPLTTESAFGGRIAGAHALRAWIDSVFPDAEFPFV
jgi:hypothetical protein